jgi:WD40 repeat protein
VAEKHIYKGDKYQFSRIATTSDGNYVVGSDDGTIRLYNNKVNNKTKAVNKFPNMEKVMHLDTTKDGKWILATFPTHLILLPTDFE